MQIAKKIRLCLIVFLYIFLLFYAFYCIISIRLFVYGVGAQFRGHQQTGILTHKLIIVKHPFSIISPLSKSVYFFDRLTKPKQKRINIDIRTNIFEGLNWLPRLSAWRVNGFTFVALLIYVYCFVILNLFRLDRQKVKASSFKNLMKFLFLFLIFGFWALFVSWQITPLNHLVKRLSYNTILGIDLFWSLISFIIFLKALKKVNETGKISK